jgi:hypothetical protein
MKHGVLVMVWTVDAERSAAVAPSNDAQNKPNDRSHYDHQAAPMLNIAIHSIASLLV